MPAIDQKRVRDLFLAAAELSDVGRQAYLADACGPDAGLRAAVDRLLAAHAEPASILDPATIDYPVPGVNSPSSPTGTFAAQPENYAILVGRYKLVELIGEGGMGAVWTARQTEPVKRTVAVKLIKPGMDSKAVLSRFEAERQALALMDHPNIARVLDAGTTPDNRPFFVMELVKGVPITKYCDDRKLTTRQRLELFVPVCHAIQHAHQKGIIHRDIKPSNVLVALYDDHAVPKVIDFGVAKATGQLLTEATLNTGFGNIVGTLEYMSPEQATFNNLDIDTRSDVYALGVLLYELLTGSPPFRKKELEREGILEILRVVKEVDPPRPSTRVSTAAALPTVAANRATNLAKLKMLLRDDLDWIVMKALEKDRSRRYETANGLASDINRHLTGEEVMAVPPSIGYRVRKIIRKHRGPVIAACSVLLALVCGVIGTTSGLLMAVRAKDSEADQRQLAVAESIRANEAAARALAAAELADKSREAEKIAVMKSQSFLGLTNLTEGIRLTDSSNAQLGMLRIAHAMNIAPEIPEVQEIARMQLAHYGRISQSHLRLSLQVNRTGNVIPTVFSPDGRRIFAAIDEKTGQIWDMATRKQIPLPLEHPGPITSAIFSPDGKKVLTGCGDGFTRTWDADSGKLMSRQSLRGTVISIAFTQKGTRALTTDSDGSVQVWNVDSGKYITRLPTTGGSIRSVAFSPTGSRVVIGNTDTNARLYDADTGKLILPLLSSHTDSVEAVLFSPDGSKILTGSKDQTARLWTTDTGKSVSTALPHPDTIASLAFSADGKFVLTSCSDNIVRLWRVDTPRSSLVTSLDQAGPVETVAFSSNGAFALIGSSDGSSQVWELGTGLRTTSQLAPIDAQIASLAFSPDGKRIATGHKNGSAWIRDVVSGKSVTLNPPHHGPVVVVAFSPDGRRVVTGSNDKTARIWDAETGAPISSLLTQDSPVRSAAFSPDGDRVAIGNSLGYALIWNSNSNSGGKPIRLLHGLSVLALAFSPNGKLIMTGGANKLVRLWEVNADTEKELLPQLRHTDAVVSATFSPDGLLALTGCKNGTVRVFKIGPNSLVSEGPLHTSQIRATTFSPNSIPGQTIDLVQEEPTAVRAVAFSPNGRWALTGSNDGIARIWDVKSGIALSPRIQHTLPIVNAAFSADGKQVILGNLNKAPRILDLTPNELDKRSAADMVSLAQLNSSHRIDENGRAVLLSSAELNSLWNSLRAKYPEEFNYPK
jgi:WD40 repeat protein/serine/threonine protein kinase